MRKWHRWLSLFSAVVLLWVTVTGVLHYVGAWWPVDPPSAEQLAAIEPPKGFVCPEGWRCMPPQIQTGNIMRDNLGLIHHLHGGMEAGKPGELIVMLSGLALLFFCLSGLWMYIQMWRERAARGAKDRWFWK